MYTYVYICVYIYIYIYLDAADRIELLAFFGGDTDDNTSNMHERITPHSWTRPSLLTILLALVLYDISISSSLSLSLYIYIYI